MLIFSNSFERKKKYISLRKSSSLWTVRWLFSFNWIQSIVVSITTNKHVYTQRAICFWTTLPINNRTNYQNIIESIYPLKHRARTSDSKKINRKRWKDKMKQKWTKIIRQQQVVQSITSNFFFNWLCFAVLFCVMENFEPFVVTVCARLLFFLSNICVKYCTMDKKFTFCIWIAFSTIFFFFCQVSER